MTKNRDDNNNSTNNTTEEVTMTKNRKASNKRISTQTRGSYSNVFRREAVEIAKLHGTARAAELLNVTQGSLHNWYHAIDSMGHHKARQTNIADNYKDAVSKGDGSFTKDYKNSKIGVKYTNDYRLIVALHAAEYGYKSALNKFEVRTHNTILKWIRSFGLDGYYFAK
jgi:hypothetical protein